MLQFDEFLHKSVVPVKEITASAEVHPDVIESGD